MNEMIQLNAQNQRVSLSRYMIEQIMKRLISIISDQASSLPPNAQNPNFTSFVFHPISFIIRDVVDCFLYWFLYRNL